MTLLHALQLDVGAGQHAKPGWLTWRFGRYVLVAALPDQGVEFWSPPTFRRPAPFCFGRIPWGRISRVRVRTVRAGLIVRRDGVVLELGDGRATVGFACTMNWSGQRGGDSFVSPQPVARAMETMRCSTAGIPPDVVLAPPDGPPSHTGRATASPRPAIADDPLPTPNRTWQRRARLGEVFTPPAEVHEAVAVDGATHQLEVIVGSGTITPADLWLDGRHIGTMEKPTAMQEAQQFRAQCGARPLTITLAWHRGRWGADYSVEIETA